MTNPSVEVLAKIPLLHALKPELLAQLSSVIQLREVVKQDCLLHKGDQGNGLIFLLHGRLLVVDVTPEGKQIGLNFLVSGDFLGELAIIDNLPRSATVVAVTTSQVAILPKAHAKRLIFENPIVAERMMQHVALRLRASTDYRTLLGIPNAFQRVLSLMQMLAKPDPGKLMTIEDMPTHEQIALMVNTSRETVTRAMQVLNDEKVIEKDNHRLIIRFPNKLHLIIQRIAQEKSS